MPDGSDGPGAATVRPMRETGTIGNGTGIPHKDDAGADTDDSATGLLPDWYMPVPMGGRVGGWRRAVALVIIAAFLLITAYGLCNTYGDLLL